MSTVLGMAPDEWPEATLAEICDLQTAPSSANTREEENVTDGVPLVAPRNLRNGRIVDYDLRRITTVRAEALKSYRLAEGDVLCTRTGALARCARVRGENVGWCYTSGLLRLRLEDDVAVDSEYLAHYLRLPAVAEWVERNATGSVVPSIGRRAFGTLPVLIPPADVQRSVVRVLGLLEEEIEMYEQAGRTASQLRDRLAPLLMSGRLREPDLDAPPEPGSGGAHT